MLYTHGHADHVLGLDDMRRFNALQDARIPCYGDALTMREVRQTFSYIFDRCDAGRRRAAGDRSLHASNGTFFLGTHEITPVPLWHGKRLVYGYRIGSLAYLTDCSAIPDASWELIEGVEVLVIDALRHRPHPTHFSVADALAVVDRLGPRAGVVYPHLPRFAPRRRPAPRCLKTSNWHMMACRSASGWSDR